MVLSSLVVAASMTLGAPEAAAKNLRVTSQLPPTHPITANLTAFKEMVEKESNGELTIEIFHSAQLYKDKEVPQAVSSGAIDMGTASLTRFAGTIPAVDMFYVPFLLPSYEASKKATIDFVRKETKMGVIVPTDEQIKDWQKASQPVVDIYIKNAGELGRKLVDAARKIK